MNRTEMLRRLEGANPGGFDIAIIGGGATGLGIAVDAASRGHRVLLVEQADFAKGTSSRSTKLVHGGVRYLKQGNVSLVLEALHERGLLCRNAPHLVHPLPFIIPAYHWWEGPFYGAGLKMYDALAGDLGMEPSRLLSPEETLELLPTIETEGLTGGIIYHDGQFDDARLAIHLAMTAAEHGATLLNYTRCTGLIKEDGLVRGIEVVDDESGAALAVRARCVINATGVFVDHLRQMDSPTAAKLVSPSQGVHLVLPRSFLPGDTAIMIPKTDDGRVLFAVPWHDRVILGTTDTAVETPDLEPRPLPEEIEFLLKHAARYLTRDPLPEDVLAAFAGLRPLVAAQDEEATSALSRDHTIEVAASGMITITGGKWTTYRRMAEDAVDQAQWLAGLESKPCVTESLRLHGATSTVVTDVHGTDRADMVELENNMVGGQEIATAEIPVTRGEVAWFVRHEMARTVEDVLARRTRWLLRDARASISAAPVIAGWLAEELGCDEHWVAAQGAAYAELARGYLLV